MFGFNSLFGNKSSNATPDAVVNNTVVTATGTLGELFLSGAFGKAMAEVNFECDFPEQAKAMRDEAEKVAAAKAEAEKAAKAEEPKPEAKAAPTEQPKPEVKEAGMTTGEAMAKFNDGLRGVKQKFEETTASFKPAEATAESKVEVTITVTTPQTDKPTMAEEVIQAAERSEAAATEPEVNEPKVVEVLNAGDLAEAAKKLADKHHAGKKR